MEKFGRWMAVILCLAMLVMTFSGCAALGAYINKLKGELFGNDYRIQQFDDFGNLVFTVYGDKVTMDCELDEYGEVSSYVDITIDGQSWKHVGSTLVFAQNGVDMITDFQLPEGMENETGGTGLGLSIVKHAAHYHNARINLQSTPGIGTRITVTF